jgi:hypothetical protein
MAKARAARAAAAPPAAVSRAARRWLLLVHQLPASPSNLRVKTWRRLQELGALPIKQSVYVLPDSPDSREDFEWLRIEIEAAGGEAVIFGADHLASDGDTDLVEAFRRDRQTAYTALAVELQQAGSKRSAPLAPRDLSRFQHRFQAIERIDFFSSAGRDRVASLLASLDTKAPASPTGNPHAASRSEYQGRLWVTRPRPGVDRMASAWLIRRFIDAQATFAFVTDARNAPKGAVPFDMYGAGIGHDGDRCTFEHLVAKFALTDGAVVRLAQVVHDLDLKDGKFGAPEAVTLGAAIDGLQLSCGDDHRLLEQGMILFEAMYRSFGQRATPARPRPVARRRRPAR